MGLFLIVAVDLLLGGLLVGAIGALRERRARRREWIALAGLMLLGGVLGDGFASLDYKISPTLRVVSFPMPAAIFHLENGSWVDYITSDPFLIAIFNIFFFVLLATTPVAYRCWQNRPHRFKEHQCSNCGYNLTGNTSGRCPECGTRIDSNAHSQATR